MNNRNESPDIVLNERKGTEKWEDCVTVSMVKFWNRQKESMLVEMRPLVDSCVGGGGKGVD